MASPNPSAAPGDFPHDLTSNRPQGEPYETPEEEIAQEAVRKENPYIFPSGIPGFGNSILAPNIPFAS
jgi:hypothetical protein